MSRRLLRMVLSCSLMAFPAGLVDAQAEEAVIPGGDGPYGSLIDCVKESRSLGVLFLIDMSSSLYQLNKESGTDPKDERVRASQAAVDAMYELGQSLEKQEVQIDVRFDGFGENYLPGRWTRLGSEVERRRARDDVDAFRFRDTDRFTNYSQALQEASAALETYDNCSLLLWFTDGRYDTDNDNAPGAPFFSEAEISEIRGDSLCGAQGPVERLRKSERPLIVVGLGKSSWSNSQRTREFALLRSIAEGTPVPPDLQLGPNYVCGTSDPLGVFEEVQDSSTLVEDLVREIMDALVDGTKGPGRPRPGESVYEDLCPASIGTCEFDFVLGNYVRSFALYVKTPGTSQAEFTLTKPSGDVQRIQEARVDVGLGIAATRAGSWFWLEGSNPSPGEDWTGRWNIQISGYEGDAPQIIAQILPGAVAIEAGPSYNPSLEDLTESDLELQLRLGDIPLVENAISEALSPEITIEAKLGDGDRLVNLAQRTDPETGISKRVLLATDLMSIASAASGWEWALELEGEADFVVLNSLKHRVEVDPTLIWFAAQADIEIRGAQIIDREARENDSSRPGITLALRRNGVAVPQHPSFEVTIDVGLSIGGTEVALLDSIAMRADGTFEVPSEAVDEALRAGDGSQLQMRVTPTVVHLATGSTQRSEVALLGSLGIRADDGLPVLFDHEVQGVSEADPDAPVIIRLKLEPPRQGVGSVEVLRIISQPALEGEYVGRTFALGDATGCDEISADVAEFVFCEVEVTHDFRAALPEVGGLTIEYQLDGSDVKSGNRPEPQPLEVKSFPIERPPDTGTFLWVLVLSSLGFAVIQVLVRAVYTTVIAKWIKTPLGSRYAEIAVRITEANNVVPADGNGIRVELQVLKFASEFEKAKSHGQIGEQTFTIGWLKTFIGERSGLRFQQEPMVRVTSPGSFVIGPEGFDPPTASGCAGVVPVGLARAWTIRIPSSARTDLANKAAVNGVLWFILRPQGEQSIDVQLDRLQQTLESVAERNIGALRAALATPVPEADSHTEPEVVNRQTDSTPPASPDPFNAPSSDPFGEPSPTAPTNSSDQPSPPRPPSSGFDPFA